MPIKFDHQFNTSADQLWAILGAPDRIDWVPGAASCAFDGSVRSLYLPGAGYIKERILSHNNEARRIEYACFEAPGPLQSHHSSMHVIDEGKRCRLIWETAVTPIEIEKFIQTSMGSCIQKLSEILSQIDHQ